MQVGEVLGKIECDAKDKRLCGVNLKVVRLYVGGKPDKVIVAEDKSQTSGNGDFVWLVSSSEVKDVLGQRLMSTDLVISGFVNNWVMPYGDTINIAMNN